MNTEFTCTLPPYQIAADAIDIMAHVFERYFTTTEDVEITDRMCEAVLLTMIKETPKVIKDSNDYEARANIMWARMVDHNNLCGVGRVQDWSSHMIEHELSALYDVAHGAGLGAKEEDIPAMVEKFGLIDGETLGSFVKLTKDDVTAIYKLAL